MLGTRKVEIIDKTTTRRPHLGVGRQRLDAFVLVGWVRRQTERDVGDGD